MIAAMNLAEAEHARGNTLRAIEIAREVIRFLRAGSDKGMLATTLQNTSGYLVAIDDLSGSISAARESISMRAAADLDPVSVSTAVEHLALAYALGGDLERAARQEGYSNAFLDRHDLKRENTETKTYDRLMTLLRGKLASDELAKLLAEGAALTAEAVVALALEESDP
jgi:hypothetical protein